MDLADLSERLAAFCRDRLGDPHATVSNVETMPGHAGFSFGFTVASNGESRSYVLRVPPPNVRRTGTADVIRQARVIHALRGTDVPVAEVIWSGEDERWFGSPYFIVNKFEGDVLRNEWGQSLSAAQLRPLAAQAMRALASLHLLDWREFTPDDGPPLELAPDVTRWDRFQERSGDPDLVALAPAVRAKLLERLPKAPRTGIFHGDFQWSNVFYSFDGTLLAVIDWELWGVGATLNDLGWVITFADAPAWKHGLRHQLPSPDALIADYVERYGRDPGDIAWYRALAAYKFAIISGFNLYLHRTGKRPDESWEDTALSAPFLLRRALELLDGGQAARAR